MTKKMISPIQKVQIRLRLLKESDLPITLKWRNQDHIRKWFIHPEIISQEQHQTWFEEYLKRDNDYVFIIEEIQNFRKPVGQISLYNINWLGKCAELGRLMIGEPETIGKGLAKKATELLVEFAFKQFHLTEIYLEVFKNNSPAIAIYRKCKFDYFEEYQNLVIMKLFNSGI